MQGIPRIIVNKGNLGPGSIRGVVNRHIPVILPLGRRMTWREAFLGRVPKQVGVLIRRLPIVGRTGHTRKVPDPSSTGNRGLLAGLIFRGSFDGRPRVANRQFPGHEVDFYVPHEPNRLPNETQPWDYLAPDVLPDHKGPRRVLVNNRPRGRGLVISQMLSKIIIWIRWVARLVWHDLPGRRWIIHRYRDPLLVIKDGDGLISRRWGDGLGRHLGIRLPMVIFGRLVAILTQVVSSLGGPLIASNGFIPSRLGIFRRHRRVILPVFGHNHGPIIKQIDLARPVVTRQSPIDPVVHRIPDKLHGLGNRLRVGGCR